MAIEPLFENPNGASSHGKGWRYNHTTGRAELESQGFVFDSDYSTLQAAADAAVAARRPLWIDQDWTFPSTLSILGDVSSNPRAVLTYTGSGTAIKIGDGTTQRFYNRVFLPNISTTKTWSPGSLGNKVAIQVDSVHACVVDFVQILSFTIGLQLRSTNGSYGISYATFSGGGVFETAIPLQLNATEPGTWVNENTFAIGTYGDPNSATAPLTKVTGTRGIELITGSGGEPINNNTFFRGALEQAHFEYAIYTENALYNTWISPRLETPSGFGEIHFGQTGAGESSFRNLILMGYGSDSLNITESAASYGNSVVGAGTFDLRGSHSTRAILHLQNSNSGNARSVAIYSPTSSPTADTGEWNVDLSAYRVRMKSESDTEPRLSIATTSGIMSFGPGGSTAADTTFSRSAAGVLASSGAFKPASYTTAGRPSASAVGAGAMIYDTTLSKPVWSNGSVWKDAAGTTV